MPDAYLFEGEGDGLPMWEGAGFWTKEKYSFIYLYNKLFSTGMKNKWDTRVYIDLFAGSGYVRLGDTNRILMGSPLIALSVPDKFEKYIFCESNSDNMVALKQRVDRHFPAVHVDYVFGDCNNNVEKIMKIVPTPSRHNRVLSLCLADPYNIGGIKFSTIKRLSDLYMDFLILLALGMDANRNRELFSGTKNQTIEIFLDDSEWRSDWTKEGRSWSDFPDFIARKYSEQMEALGYLGQPLHKMKLLRNDQKNAALYRLALFSRKKTAYVFWAQALKYGTQQRTFEDGGW